ncbi:hypothetical protein GJ744_004976 [Endocarpon pusillum]|uniref:HIG1 domain-containing protein n=1 Tax=Endocarpon pusillum TaxID=364733 RepID=A0A8H7DYZ0_9EURO|nr:hypothetical protein GJ744_004976 [Endocarpon pusillum]
MAARPIFYPFRASLVISIPLLLDLAYHEGYLVPSTIPNLYAESQWKEVIKPKGIPFHSPPSLTWNRYHTENPLHAQYIYAKKSFWRYKLIWAYLGASTTVLQLYYIFSSLRARRVTRAIAAASVMGLTWTAILVEGKTREMYLDKMQEKVLKEEEAFTG